MKNLKGNDLTKKDVRYVAITRLICYKMIYGVYCKTKPARDS